MDFILNSNIFCQSQPAQKLNLLNFQYTQLLLKYYEYQELLIRTQLKRTPEKASGRQSTHSTYKENSSDKNIINSNEQIVEKINRSIQFSQIIEQTKQAQENIQNLMKQQDDIQTVQPYQNQQIPQIISEYKNESSKIIEIENSEYQSYMQENQQISQNKNNNKKLALNKTRLSENIYYNDQQLETINKMNASLNIINKSKDLVKNQKSEVNDQENQIKQQNHKSNQEGTQNESAKKIQEQNKNQNNYQMELLDKLINCNSIEESKELILEIDKLSQLNSFKLENFKEFDAIQFLIKAKQFSIELLELTQVSGNMDNEQLLILQTKLQLNETLLQQVITKVEENQSQLLNEILEQIWGQTEIDQNILNGFYDKIIKYSEMMQFAHQQTLNQLIEEIGQTEDNELLDFEEIDEINENENQQNETKEENPLKTRRLQNIYKKISITNNQFVELYGNINTNEQKGSDKITKRRSSLSVLKRKNLSIGNQLLVEEAKKNKTLKKKALKFLTITPELLQNHRNAVSFIVEQSQLVQEEHINENIRILLQKIHDLYQKYGFKLILKKNCENDMLVIKFGETYYTLEQYVQQIKEVQIGHSSNQNRDINEKFAIRLQFFVCQLEGELEKFKNIENIENSKQY